jgi:hypothetical protein
MKSRRLLFQKWIVALGHFEFLAGEQRLVNLHPGLHHRAGHAGLPVAGDAGVRVDTDQCMTYPGDRLHLDVGDAHFATVGGC